MTRKNPSYIDRGHPVRQLLEAAAMGHEPSSSDLDRALTRTDLPDGHDLGRFRSRVARAAAEIAHTHSPTPNVANYRPARDLADAYVATLAAEMSDAEASLTGADPTTTEPLAAITARIFGR